MHSLCLIGTILYQKINDSSEQCDSVLFPLTDNCLHSWNAQADSTDIEGDAQRHATLGSPHEVENDAQRNVAPGSPHEVENDVGEFEVIRMISECLGRYDRACNGEDTEFVDTSDGAKDWDDHNGGCEDETTEEGMAKLLEE